MKVAPYVSLALAFVALCIANPALGASSCVTSACHATISNGTMVHAPVKENDCTSCHTQRAKEHPIKQGKSFELAAQGADLCSQCHDKKFTMKVVHRPVKKGECTSCHQPHASSGKALLNMGDNQTDFCLRCHTPGPFQQRYMHGPAAVGTCNECHDPHQSNEKALLKGQVRDLCLKCHADFDKTLRDAPMVHPPVKVGPCTSCHNAHGSATMYFLNKKLPDLCIDCHGNIGKKLKVVKVPHKPVMAEGGCTNCHAAHISKAKGMLAADEMAVCLSCHDKELGQPPLRNIKKDLEGKKFLHGPIKKGSCKACHDPHGSEYFRMLPGAYPASLYVPYKDGLYDACLKCHEKNLLRFPETSLYTKFRNGKRNLHFVHVANKQKGRTCRICHEPHAGDLDKLIRKEGYKFGEWKIPLNFTVTENGGRCAPGCHRAFVYDREKPVRYGGYSSGKYYVVK
ncbi:cytochrome c3 family protein [Geomesophilobacter sediminis]|uniref:Cytochrome c3 family protein n=1 Tax=Geomesophilobacter sediminis TaxID=2798584 RepID=A0A8J7M220_9BACT|nr:cytochrome c3 family protein [Geomesophilobacter sediminis]MBJ6727265.1 cytochrome c3 family protein [Geomesophilobacter sediminis]